MSTAWSSISDLLNTFCVLRDLRFQICLIRFAYCVIFAFRFVKYVLYFRFVKYVLSNARSSLFLSFGDSNLPIHSGLVNHSLPKSCKTDIWLEKCYRNYVRVCIESNVMYLMKRDISIFFSLQRTCFTNLSLPKIGNTRMSWVSLFFSFMGLVRSQVLRLTSRLQAIPGRHTNVFMIYYVITRCQSTYVMKLQVLIWTLE